MLSLLDERAQLFYSVVISQLILHLVSVRRKSVLSVPVRVRVKLIHFFFCFHERPSRFSWRSRLRWWHREFCHGRRSYTTFPNENWQLFAEFCEDLYTSTTKKHEHERNEDKYEQHQDTLKPVTMQELNDAHQPTEKRKSGRHERSQRRDDQILYQKTQKAPTTTAQQSHQNPRATTTELERHDDQSYIQERGPGFTVKLQTHLFDPHLVQTLQPTSYQTTATHA